MCLTIDRTKHKFLFGKHPIPKIAFKRIKCYKMFCYDDYTNRYITPFRCRLVNPKRGKIIQHSHFGFSFNNKEVEEGIHSSQTVLPSYFSGDLLFEAHIPFGSLYFVGVDHDLVSTKLITDLSKEIKFLDRYKC